MIKTAKTSNLLPSSSLERKAALVSTVERGKTNFKANPSVTNKPIMSLYTVYETRYPNFAIAKIIYAVSTSFQVSKIVNIAKIFEGLIFWVILFCPNRSPYVLCMFYYYSILSWSSTSFLHLNLKTFRNLWVQLRLLLCPKVGILLTKWKEVLSFILSN